MTKVRPFAIKLQIVYCIQKGLEKVLSHSRNHLKTES